MISKDDPSSKTHIGIATALAPMLVTIHDLAAQVGADAVVRLQELDFAHLPAEGDFVHFNLGTTSNEVGRRYALLPIVVPGHRLPDGNEVLPVVDPARVRIAICTAVAQRVPLKAVTTDQFARSLPTIRTPDMLRRALLDRYAGMIPDLTPAAVDENGCAISSFVLEKQS